VDVHPHLHFRTEDATLRGQLTTLYIQEMAKRGCHGYASFYLNASQGEPELGQTVQAAREVFGLIREAAESGHAGDYLECAIQQDAFRRMVR
jgi:glutamate-1-semialdehyde 2,1-aminomutase